MPRGFKDNGGDKKGDKIKVFNVLEVIMQLVLSPRSLFIAKGAEYLYRFEKRTSNPRGIGCL